MAAKKTAKKTTPKKETTSKRAKPEGKLSALDAATKVLAEAGEPLNAKQMIDAMAEKGYWKSPGGKTPHATLYRIGGAFLGWEVPGIFDVEAQVRNFSLRVTDRP